VRNAIGIGRARGSRRGAVSLRRSLTGAFDLPEGVGGDGVREGWGHGQEG